MSDVRVTAVKARAAHAGLVWLRALTLAVSMLAAAANASAQVFNWTFAGWDGGGCYPNVTFDPYVKGRLYLTSDVAGAWVSDDNGETWRFATKGLTSLHVTQIAVSASTPGVLYAAAQHGLYVSMDSAQSWTKADDINGRMAFERPASYRGISVSAKSAGSVCAGTMRGDVFCSETFGKNWRDLGIGAAKSQQKGVAAVQHLPDGSGLLAARDDGIFAFNFATGVWSPGPAGLTKVTDLIPLKSGFAAAADGALWLSDAQGKAWRRVEARVPGPLYRLDYDTATSRLYAAWVKDWSGGTLVSTDEGANWTAIGKTYKPDLARDPTRQWSSPAGNATALKVSPHDPRVLIMTDWWGVWRSDDQGATWTEKIAGAPNTVGSDLKFSPSGELYVATMDNGLLMSADKGRSYRALFPSSGFRPDINGHVWRVAFAGGDRVIATSSPWTDKINQIILGDGAGGALRQTRAGLPAARPTTETLWDQGYPRALAVDPNEPGTVYLGIDGSDGGGLYISRDRGETWVRSPGQPGSVRIYNALAVDPKRRGVLYWGAVGGGAGGGIYRSSDGGRTWELKFGRSRAIFDILVAGDGTVYATADQNGAAVYVSRDQGETWNITAQLSPHGTAKAIAANPVNPKMIAAGTVGWDGSAPHSIHLTRDGGEHWTDITGDLPDGAGASALAFTPDGKELFVSRNGGGIYKLRLPNTVP